MAKGSLPHHALRFHANAARPGRSRRRAEKTAQRNKFAAVLLEHPLLLTVLWLDSGRGMVGDGSASVAETVFRFEADARRRRT